MLSRLAHYEILEPLGKGGMGEVFLARDTRLDRRVALKVLPAEMAADRDRLERFQREARAVAALNHPNIVTLYSVEEADGRHFLTMELVEGATLAARVPERGLAAAELVELGIQIADALRAAHERGVTHRDLKPANIMVDRDGRVRVLDFGLAKVRRGGASAGAGAAGSGSSGDDESTAALTQAGAVMGTVPYMSPEQLQGRTADAPSDLFSLGIVLYEMATGKRPFAGQSSVELASAILRDDPPPLARGDELDAALDPLLRRCLAKEAERRCTAVELLAGLRALHGGHASAAGRDATPLAVGQPTPPQRPKLVGRDAETERLGELLAETRSGRGALALLTGEEGVGKTRLAQEIWDQGRRDGFLVLVGRCRDMEGAQPYLPLIEQIESAGRMVSPRALRRALGPNAPEVAKLMPDLRQRFDDIPEAVNVPPEQERRYVMHGVTAFIERAAAVQPMILVYEDLHWADDSTLLLLRHLAQRLREMPVLVLATYRDTELRPGSALATVVEDLTRGRLAEEVRLKRLGREQVALVIADRAGKEPPDELVSLVYSETEGNPFFVEEVYRHLDETGQIFDDQGGWRSGIHRAETEVPRSVGLAIGQRLERVGADCRTALTAAAVLGRTFRFDVLARVVTGVDEDRLLDAIEEAETAALIAEASTGREARYSFAHEQIRHALLAGLSTPRRQRLHLRVANALEAIHGARAESRATEIAHHLYEAGAAADAERTFRYLVLAAHSNREALAFEDALRLLDAAQEVVDEGDGEERARLFFARALTLRSLARMDEALSAFAQSLQLGPPAALRYEILAARARLLLDLFRGREAREDLERMLQAARDGADRERELEVLLALGRAHYVLSLDDPETHARASRDTYERALALAEELGDRRAMARALIPTGWFTDYWRDYHQQAVANLERARRLAAEIGDEGLELEVRANQVRLVPSGRAAAEAEEVRRLLEARRDPVPLKELYFLMMWNRWTRADFEGCREVCDAGIALARELGSEPVQYSTIKALALLDLGRFDQAWRSLEEEVADDAHRFGRCMQQLGVALYEARLGAWERAAATASATLREAEALKRVWMQSWMVDLLRSLVPRLGESAAKLEAELGDRDAASYFRAFPEMHADALLASGRAEEALEQVRATVERSDRAGTGRVSITSREVELRALAALGRHDELVTASDRALERSEAAAAEAWTWRLRALRARALLALGRSAEGDDEAARARAIFDRLRGTIPQPELGASFAEEDLAAWLSAATAE